MDMMDMDMDRWTWNGDGRHDDGHGDGHVRSRRIETDPVDYKLIRFYDFAGFRNLAPIWTQVRVPIAVLRQRSRTFPSATCCSPNRAVWHPRSPTVCKRLMAEAIRRQIASDCSNGGANGVNRPSRCRCRRSSKYFAGPVDPGTINHWKVAGKEVEYTRDPPKAKIVASPV